MRSYPPDPRRSSNTLMLRNHSPSQSKFARPRTTFSNHLVVDTSQQTDSHNPGPLRRRDELSETGDATDAVTAPSSSNAVPNGVLDAQRASVTWSLIPRLIKVRLPILVATANYSPIPSSTDQSLPVHHSPRTSLRRSPVDGSAVTSDCGHNATESKWRDPGGFTSTQLAESGDSRPLDLVAGLKSH